MLIVLLSDVSMLTYFSAGVTDSRLTSHGVLQTQRLGDHLTSKGLQFSQLFSSDLQRARMTAEAIRTAQLSAYADKGLVLEVVPLQLLREQDFGSFECLPWASKAANNDVYPDAMAPSFRPKETKESMQARAEEFLNVCLLPLLCLNSVSTETVAVVSHGLFLSTLWRSLCLKFPSQSIYVAPDVGAYRSGRPLEHLPGWSNTGYLELHINQDLHSPEAIAQAGSSVAPSSTSTLVGLTMNIVTVNGKQHLSNLRRTRGGLGSVTYDSRQRKLDGFFKKPNPSKPTS